MSENVCERKEEQALSCCAGGGGSLKKQLVMLIVSLVSVVLSFVLFRLKIYSDTPYAVLDFAWVSVVLCGFPIYKKAFVSLKNKKINAAVLISTAMTASLFMGIFTTFSHSAASGHHIENYFFVAGEVPFLMSIGGFIEAAVIKRTSSALEGLIRLQPTTATVATPDGYRIYDIADVEKGQVVLVRAKETIPVDGKVIKGESSVDTAALTGEAFPVEVRSGSEVFAGTVNITGNIEIEVTKRSTETVIGQVADYYKKANAKKAPIVGVADRFASKIVPIVIVVALLVFCLVSGLVNVTEGVRRGVAILVVFCPCALALATPTAISASIGNASRKGILVKNGATLEMLSKINTVAFDKTGTLTTGNIWVERVHTKRMKETELIHYAASCEYQSEHPIGKAIVAHAKGDYVEPTETRIETGKGIYAMVDGREVAVLKLSAVESIETEEWAKDINRAKSVVAVLIDGATEGLISLSDTVRASAKSAMETLKENGYGTLLLTGDNNYSAKTIAKHLEIDEYHYNLLPVEKADIITQAKENGCIVLTTGDGINDAPAFAASDASLSMGIMGNQVAIDAADCSILDDDLNKINDLLALSKRAVKRIKINIAVSMTINLVAVILSSLGYLNAVWGALLHNLSSVLVCTSSALLLRDAGQRIELPHSKKR